VETSNLTTRLASTTKDPVTNEVRKIAKKKTAFDNFVCFKVGYPIPVLFSITLSKIKQNDDHDCDDESGRGEV
jgi:tRNA A37 threonylcarbamoyladenosine dehydratase